MLLLSRPGEDPLVGIPLTNSIGWCLLPPNFSTYMETVADLANAALENPAEQVTAKMIPHCLDTISKMAPMDIPPITTAHILSITTAHIPSISCTAPFKKPLQYWGIYVDNFCCLVRGNRWTRCWVKRILLHLLDRVFRQLDNSDAAI